MIFTTSAGVRMIATIDENDVPLNVAPYPTRRLYFQKPNGTVLTQTASLLTDGSDGKIFYETPAGFFDTAGTWYLRGRVEIDAAHSYPTAWRKFVVGE